MSAFQSVLEKKTSVMNVTFNSLLFCIVTFTSGGTSSCLAALSLIIWLYKVYLKNPSARGFPGLDVSQSRRSCYEAYGNGAVVHMGCSLSDWATADQKSFIRQQFDVLAWNHFSR